MPFDGTTFRALDDDAVDDGVNLDDQALDVFLEQSIASNSRYLHTGYDGASVPYWGEDSDFTPPSSERVFCSRQLSRTHFFPLVLTHGVTSVTVDFLVQVAAEDSGGTNVDFELRLVQWGASVGSGRRLATREFSVATTTGYDSATETVTLPSPITSGEQLVWLEIWQKGDAAGDTGSNITASTINADGFSTSKNITGLDAYRTRYLVSDTTGEEYDIVAVATRAMVLWPSPAQEEDGTVFSVHEARYSRIRSISIRVNANGLIASGAPTPDELVAQRSVRAGTTLLQAAAANSCYARARHIGFGPAGEASPEETSAQPWYLWRQAPMNEVQIDGLLQDNITGRDQFLCVVCWTTNQKNMTIDTSLEAFCEILDSGDTGWDDATLVGGGSLRRVYDIADTQDGRDYMQAQLNLFRELEDADRIILREGHSWPGEVNNMMTTFVPVTLLDDFSLTRHSRPFRIRFQFTTNETPFATNPRYYICGYSLVAIGRYDEGSL